jgi:hypothetical protein
MPNRFTLGSRSDGNGGVLSVGVAARNAALTRSAD